MSSEFPVDAGLLNDKEPQTTAVFKNTKTCTFYITVDDVYLNVICCRN
jgi:hypothetical protein